MSKPSSSLADRLAIRFRSIESTRRQIEFLHKKELLNQKAVLFTYEGLFLSSHIQIENFIEELFIGLVIVGKGVDSSRDNVSPRVEIRSHGVARQLILGPKNDYIDWVPFDNSVKLAKLFFRGGRPFHDLGQPHKDVIARSHIIRNAIAHKSKHSMKKFHDKIIGSAQLPPQERTPAGYLRGLFRANPPQTRFSNLLSQLLLCARELAQ